MPKFKRLSRPGFVTLRFVVKPSLSYDNEYGVFETLCGKEIVACYTNDIAETACALLNAGFTLEEIKHGSWKWSKPAPIDLFRSRA